MALGVRMLVAFAPPIVEEEAVAAVLEALSASARPFGLRFAVPAHLAPAFDALMAAGDALKPGDVRYYGGELVAVPSLLTDETHFLRLSGAHGFSQRWDAELYAALRMTGDASALLTGCIRPPGHRARAGFSGDAPTLRHRPLDVKKLSALVRASAQTNRTRPFRLIGTPPPPAPPPLPAEAYLPAFVQDFEDDGVLVDRGLPLVCAAGPVKTLAVNPGLLFAPVRFLREAELAEDTLSIAVYVAGWHAYALPRPLMWPLAPQPSRLRHPPALPGTTLARFEQMAGFRYDKRLAGLKTTWGLFGADNAYAQRLPAGMAVGERLRAARMYLRESHMPLMVCAFIDLAHPSRPVMSYMLRFGFLHAISSLPVLLYTGGAQERMLRSIHPNTRSFPTVLRSLKLTPRQRLWYAKPQLLLKAAQAHAEFTHVAWLSLDALPHPVCPDAVPDFSHLMDSRIHLATVNGVPDTGFLLIPVKHVALIAREAAALAQIDVDAGRTPSEDSLWERLFLKFPDLFAIHRMPARGLLFLTAFDPRLLCHALRARLANLPPPHYATMEDVKPTIERSQKP